MNFPIDLIVVGGLVVFYLVRVLLFEEKVSHYGPWPSKRRQVVWYKMTKPSGFYEYTQPVTAFDWVRRIFGVYRVSKIGDKSQGTEEELWYVNEARAEVWTCPVCLSFWMAILPAAYIAVVSSVPNALLSLVAMAAISVLLHSFRDAQEATSEFYGRPPQEFVVALNEDATLDDSDQAQV